MTLFACIGCGVDVMAESCGSCILEIEYDLSGVHTPVAAATVGCYGECALAVMAGSAGSAFFHLGHGHISFITVENLAIVAALAGAAGLGYMDGMTEGRITKPLDLVRDIAGFAFMAADAILFAGNTERFHTRMAGAAGSGFFHFSHSEVSSVSQVENSIVADFAVIVILLEVKFVAEYDRFSILDGELYVLGLGCSGADCREQD